MNKIFNSCICLILILAYYKFSSIRLLVPLILIIVTIIFIKILENKFKIQNDIILLNAIITISSIAIFSIYGGSFEFFFATLIFLILATWPLLIKLNKPNLAFTKLLRVYIFSAFFLSVGVIIQSFLFKNYGVSFGKIDLYGGGRLAFGFTWTDYSFLSLYLTSCVPLILSSKFDYKFTTKLVMVILVLVASLVTTARTGFTSFIIVFTIYVLFNFIKVFSSKKLYYLMLFLLITSPIGIYLGRNYTILERKISTSSSGRLEGYQTGIDFFINNPLLGIMFNPSLYHHNVEVIPHNIFIYLAVTGGTYLLLLSSWWLFTIFYRAYKIRDSNIFYSFLICLIGFQFVPSVYSAYFFAILSSFVLIKYRYKV